jgi:hypothetical protein
VEGYVATMIQARDQAVGFEAPLIVKIVFKPNGVAAADSSRRY